MRLKKIRESGKLVRGISELLKLPTEVTCGDTRMIMIGRSKLKIENYRGILIYTETMIKIQAINLIVSIDGKRLQIRYYDQDEMEIIGWIEDVRFE